VKCIIDNQVVLSRTLEGPFPPHIGQFGRPPSEQRYSLVSIPTIDSPLPREPVDGTRLCRAMSGGFARRDLKFPIQIRRRSPLREINRRQDYPELTCESMLLQAPSTKGLERLAPPFPR
jgi:hypothetical protein